jgi:hypothetical protein
MCIVLFPPEIFLFPRMVPRICCEHVDVLACELAHVCGVHTRPITDAASLVLSSVLLRRFQAFVTPEHLRGSLNEDMCFSTTGCIAKQSLNAKGLRVTGVHGSDSTATRLGCNSLPTCALRTNIHRRKLVTQLVASSPSEAVAGEQPIVRAGAVTPGVSASEAIRSRWHIFKVGEVTSDRTA